MIKVFLDWLANTNFFDRPTFIRKWQCDLFGHEWYAWGWREKTNVNGHDGWCAWCARPTGEYPMMRARPDKINCACKTCVPPKERPATPQ